MKDITSLLIATTMLAVGGLGLFMYGNKDNTRSDPEIYNESEYDEYDESEDKNYNNEEEDTKGGSTIKNFFNSLFSSDNNDSEKDSEKSLEEYEEPQYETRSRVKKSKTKRQRKSVGTKRRY
jgi:hypothetical protein